MRPFLALDTATDHLALAIGDLDAPGAVLAAADFRAPRAANTVVLLAAERLMESIALEPASLEAVAVGRGPGSFTGVRIGAATAKGLAHGLCVPLVGFGTLDAVAHNVGAEGLIGVVGDAMRGEVYPALFRAHAGTVVRLVRDRVAPPGQIAAEWAALGETVLLTGNGVAKHEGVLLAALGERGVLASERLRVPNGPSILAAAWAADGDRTLMAIRGLERDAAYAAAHPGAMLPIYTRLSDAEEAERVRAGGESSLPDGGVAGPGEARA
ncbi:MAG: tRNA (adenosine(37)-N6)-threonylcarbamoyltransferase complex dimerization subunit type 1 TsaB [Coriobacteriia bacterium]|nr:tRNA (adenosine(37)-N6)-threonylcarbamoyltransferase complex dimerization subunit type 1 TsaB [Coriobacteriia bacterium]